MKIPPSTINNLEGYLLTTLLSADKKGLVTADKRKAASLLTEAGLSVSCSYT
jgi:hypothetical protein